jgi:hypothetical protein
MMALSASMSAAVAKSPSDFSMRANEAPNMARTTSAPVFAAAMTRSRSVISMSAGYDEDMPASRG